MPGPKPPEIKLTPMLLQILEKISRCYTNPYWLVVRAKMVLFAQAGDNNSEIARCLDTDADTVAQWRERWITATPRLSAAESGNMAARDLRSLIVATLADDFRPGMPDTFTPPSANRPSCGGGLRRPPGISAGNLALDAARISGRGSKARNR